MTSKKIKISDILGDNYYIYELSSSNYTPSLNANITITCTCKTVYGDAVNNKSLTLYQNGSSVSSQTTNSSGVATWTITCSSAGVQRFNIGDSIVEVFVDTTSKTGHTHTVSNITDFPSTITPSSHTHGNLQNDGSVGTSNNASKNVVTDSNGKITTEAKPTIPSKISDLTNDSNFIETSSTTGLIKNDGSIDTSTYLTSHQDITGKEDNSNKVTSWSNTTTDTHYPSEKLVKDSLDNKLEKTHSSYKGKNVVTNSSTGDIEFEDKYTHPTELSSALSTKSLYQIKANTKGHITEATSIGIDSTSGGTASSDSLITSGAVNSGLSGKQATLVSGTNIKTINNNSLLGSGNISISTGSNVDIVTSTNGWNTTTSDTKVPSEKLVKNSLDDKISKSQTTGLVKNDGTIMSSGTGSTNWATGDHTHSGYANSVHNHAYISGGETNTTLVDDTDGTYAYAFDSNLIYDPLSSGSIFYKNTENSDELAVQGDIPTDISDLEDSNSILVDLAYQSDLGTLDIGDLTDTQNVLVDLAYQNNIPSDVSDLTDNSNTAFTPKSHTHGNLQNNGQVGSSATNNGIVLTDSSGKITASTSIAKQTIALGTSSNASKNVVTDSNGKLTTEDKPTIPSASSTTPSADTSSGSYGSGTDYARANHTHPQSSLYAESNHNHDSSYLAKSSTDTGFVKSNGNIVSFGTNSGTVAEGNHTHSGYASSSHTHSTSDITDLPVITATTNLPTASSTYEGKICILTKTNGIELYFCDK